MKIGVLFKNWKTTLSAIVGVTLFVLSQLGIEVLSINSWGEIVGVIVGIGGIGIGAKDGDKTSIELGLH